MSGQTASAQRRLLFAKLGSFSYTNERMLEQLTKQFPDHEIVTFDVKEHIRDQFGVKALNALLELATFGPSVFKNAADRHGFFFLTPFMFRRLSAAIQKHFAAQAASFDAVLQTQGLFNAALPGCPLVIYTDCTIASNLDFALRDERLLRSQAFRRLEHALYHRADRILTSATHVKDSLVRHYQCDPARITPIMIGANVAAVASGTGLERYEAGRILFVGLEWERKGGATLLGAFDRLAERFPQASLTIVGSAPETTHPRIRVLGRLPRDAVARHFAEASIFCLPSVVEPSAVASVEAMAFGLPVVATHVGGFPEMVADGQTGLLVPPRDPAALAEALASLLADPARARTMGLAGQQRSQMFTWDAVGARLHDRISDLINPAAARAPVPA